MTPDGPAEELGRSFKGAVAALRRLRGRETHRPGELSDAQFSLLFGLRGRQHMSTRELAFAADLSPAATTEMLEGLAAAGLVERRRSERDRRVVLVSLTDRGQAVVEEHHAAYAPRWRAALSDFSDRDLRAASAVLDRVGEFFDELDRERSAEAHPAVEMRRALSGAPHAEPDPV